MKWARLLLAIAFACGCARRNPSLGGGRDLAATGDDLAAAQDFATGRDLSAEPDLAAQDLAAQDLVARDLAMRDFAMPDLAMPDFAMPDFAMPDFAMPDFAMPDFAMPDFAMPDFAMPDFAMPDFAMPDFAMPDFAMPDFATLDLAGADLACTSIGTVENCAACGQRCETNGTSSNACVLTSTGFQCKPVCDFDHADCDTSPANGCETNLSTGGMCACDSCHSDCGGSSNSDCETNQCDDRDEPNETCPGFVLPPLTEGNSSSVVAGILPAGDVDVFQISLLEAVGCPGISENFCAEIKLTATGAGETIQAACGTSATPGGNNNLFIKWTGTCAFNDDRVVNFRITGSSTCALYQVDLRFNSGGVVCP